MSVTRRRQFLVLASILILVLILDLLISGYVRDLLIVPLLYSFWVVNVFLISLPSILLWAVFIFAAILLAFRSIPKGSDERFRRAPTRAEHYGRVAEWHNAIDLATKSHYANWKLARDLGRLSFSLLAMQERRPATDIRRRLQADELHLPDKVRAYLRVGMVNFNPFEKEGRPWWRFLFPRAEMRVSLAALEDAKGVADFLEEKFYIASEISHSQNDDITTTDNNDEFKPD